MSPAPLLHRFSDVIYIAVEMRDAIVVIEHIPALRVSRKAGIAM